MNVPPTLAGSERMAWPGVGLVTTRSPVAIGAYPASTFTLKRPLCPIFASSSPASPSRRPGLGETPPATRVSCRDPRLDAVVANTYGSRRSSPRRNYREPQRKVQGGLRRAFLGLRPGGRLLDLRALAGVGAAGAIRINGVALTPTTPLSSLSGSLVAVQGSGKVKVGN